MEACELEDACTTPDGEEGVATKDIDCEHFLTHYRKNPSKILRCGFHQRNTIVCCPKTIRKSVEQCQKFGKRPDSDCVPPPVFKITDGKRSDPGEFPHFAQLGYQKDNEYSFDCGGALISSNFVLTAAHCCKKKNSPKIVRLGKVSYELFIRML